MWENQTESVGHVGHVTGSPANQNQLSESSLVFRTQNKVPVGASGKNSVCQKCELETIRCGDWVPLLFFWLFYLFWVFCVQTWVYFSTALKIKTVAMFLFLFNAAQSHTVTLHLFKVLCWVLLLLLLLFPALDAECSFPCSICMMMKPELWSFNVWNLVPADTHYTLCVKYLDSEVVSWNEILNTDATQKYSDVKKQ